MPFVITTLLVQAVCTRQSSPGVRCASLISDLQTRRSSTRAQATRAQATRAQATQPQATQPQATRATRAQAQAARAHPQATRLCLLLLLSMASHRPHRPQQLPPRGTTGTVVPPVETWCCLLHLSRLWQSWSLWPWSKGTSLEFAIGHLIVAASGVGWSSHVWP